MTISCFTKSQVMSILYQLNKFIFITHKILDVLKRPFAQYWSFYNKGCLLYYNVEFNPARTHLLGRHVFRLSKKSNITIGDGLRCLSGKQYSLDYSNTAKIHVQPGATLTIGQNVAMTNVILHCYSEITIGDYTNIGANTMIIDTDFHSLDWRDRRDGTDIFKKKIRSIHIGNDVFIGAKSIILKGVIIGDKSIIGAGSVVSHDVPPGEIWAGNPAVFIKKLT